MTVHNCHLALAEHGMANPRPRAALQLGTSGSRAATQQQRGWVALCTAQHLLAPAGNLFFQAPPTHSQPVHSRAPDPSAPAGISPHWLVASLWYQRVSSPGAGWRAHQLLAAVGAAVEHRDGLSSPGKPGSTAQHSTAHQGGQSARPHPAQPEPGVRVDWVRRKREGAILAERSYVLGQAQRRRRRSPVVPAPAEAQLVDTGGGCMLGCTGPRKATVQAPAQGSLTLAPWALQALAAKLGVATGKHLAEQCRWAGRL